jgi:hypothetical protein
MARGGGGVALMTQGYSVSESDVRVRATGRATTANEKSDCIAAIVSDSEAIENKSREC